MSYAIAYVVYGVPLHDADDNDAENSEAIDNWLEEFNPMILTPYSGCGNPLAFGVTLDEVNECCHHVEINNLRLTPTPEEVAQVEKEFYALSDEIKEEITTKFGKPRVFILWGTS